jgi:hypothetical protein
MVYMDGAGSGAAVVDALADINIGGKLTVGVDDTGYDVKFFGATSGKYWLWDESADGVLQYSSLTVGVDDTGYDVKFFGATSGAYMLWDESADDLKLVGAAGLTVAGDIDIDGTANLDVVDIDGATQADGTITVGVDDTGYDVKFFGATSGAYMLWDESADDLKLVGAAGLTVAGDADIDGTLETDNLTIGSAQGSDGQVLTSTGSGVAWEDASGGGISGLTGLVEDNSIYLGADPSGTTSTAEKNVSLGTIALDSITTGDSNTVVGYGAGTAITTGGENDLHGIDAGGDITEGAGNVCIGSYSGSRLTTTGFNTFVGNQAGYLLTGITNSVALGYIAGGGGNGGSSLVAIGCRAGYGNNSGGAGNVSVGYHTGYYVTTGDGNVMLGPATGIASGPGTALTTGHRNILIGDTLDCSAADVDDEVVIGSGGLSGGNPVGLVGKGTDTAFISANGGGNYAGNNSASWSTTSDERIKKNIVDSTVGLAEINQIQVRNFEYRLPKEVDTELPQSAAIKKEGVQTGVIAQEVLDILPDIVKQESTGCYSVDPDNITWYLVKAVQELTARIEELEGE